jgi:hypothetical protein
MFSGTNVGLAAVFTYGDAYCSHTRVKQLLIIGFYIFFTVHFSVYKQNHQPMHFLLITTYFPTYVVTHETQRHTLN